MNKQQQLLKGLEFLRQVVWDDERIQLSPEDNDCNEYNSGRPLPNELWTVAEMLVRFLLTKVGTTAIIGICWCTAIGLCKLHDHKSLMLHWRSVDPSLTLCWWSGLGHSSDVVASIFA